MSLLDDVSIVVTPNAYKAGELYAVIPTIAYGSELVVNGDFNNGTTGWSTGNSGVLSVVDGALVVTGDGGSYASAKQIVTGVVGKTYKLTGKVAVVSGSYNVRVETDQPSWLNLFTTSSTNFVNFEASFVCVNTSIDLRFTIYNPTVTSSDKIKIDDISLKEFTGADMDVTRATAATRVDENGLVNYAEVLGGEEITNGDFATNLDSWSTSSWWVWNALGAYHPSTSSHKPLYQQCCVIGKTYLITFDLNCVGTSQAKFSLGSSTGSTTQVIGTSLTTGSYSYFVTAAAEYIVFNRQNTAEYYVNNVSVKEAARDNVPRIDYTGGGCPHILAEPQRTNLIQYSEDFTSWNQIANITLTQNSTTSPSGESDGTKFLSTSTGAKVRANFSAVSGTTYTFSVYCKNIDATLIKLLGYDGANEFNANLTSEVNTSTWTRISLTFTAANTATGQIQIARDLPDTESAYFWGAQLEVGSYPTSYIPTSGSTVTRNQDQFTRDGIGSLINSTEGVFFAEFKPKLSSDFSVLTLNNNSSQEIVFIGKYNNTNTMFVGLRHLFSYSILYTSSSQDLTIFNKVAVKWKSGDMAVWVNGVEVLTSTSTDVPIGMTELSFDFSLNQFPFYGEVKQLQVYKTALTDEQLIQLTGESGTDFYESYAEMAAALNYTIQ